MPTIRTAALMLMAALAGTPAVAEVAPDGTITSASVTLPISKLMSPEGQAAVKARVTRGPPAFSGQGVEGMRAVVRTQQADTIKRWQAIYPSDIVPTMIGGVQTDVVTPKAGIAPGNRNRVLINLHSGGFIFGAREGGQVEALPMAGTGRIKVVAVDYRMAPEHAYPAASEDVEAVYRELLKTYKPADIGIYGCSAGGALTGQVAAWLQSKGLPAPAALGVFCSGLTPGFWLGGDSAVMSAVSNPTMRLAGPGGPRGYMDAVAKDDATAVPGLSPAVLAKFPPTLLITGTRDIALSNVLITNAALLKAGVQTQLLVQEGMGHSDFNSFVGTPEAQDAWDVAWRWFDAKLGR